MKLKIEIKNRFTGEVIFEYESENNTIAKTVNELVRIANEKGENADLRSADLRSADLSSADLRSADLSFADLSFADLSFANLISANLSNANLISANLISANLISADLSTIKSDMFYVLVKGIKEVNFLRQNIIEGKIDGSTYDGECACLSGTLEHGAGKNKDRVKSIMDCRDSERPIERFFLGIKKGDTPGTNQISKIVLEWVDEFLYCIGDLT